MSRLFKKGELVRSRVDGKVKEVLKYLRNNLVEVREFDLESREVHTHRVSQNKLTKAF